MKRFTTFLILPFITLVGKLDDGVEWIVNILFLFFGKKIKGYRTVILSIGAFVIGAWEWLTGSGLFDFLCSLSETIKALTVMCNITEGMFYAVILTVIGFISALLRKITDTPIGQLGGATRGAPAQMTAGQPYAFLWVLLGVVGFVLFVLILLPMLLIGLTV